MKYTVKITDKTYEVKIDDIHARPVIARVDGELFEVMPEDGKKPEAGKEMGGTSPAAGKNPSNAKSRRQNFRERRTQQHDAFGIESFGGPRSGAAECDVAVHVIFDQRHVVFRKQRYEVLLIRVVENKAKGVVSVRDTDASPYTVLANRDLERVQIHAETRSHRRCLRGALWAKLYESYHTDSVRR